ncbi:MAG: hypothetical protein PF482_13960 [Desulfobacteraceae bacterium]|nr:hypothetical protein [Desulfobacteraceae bacterium]
MIHIEQLWFENRFTAEGRVMHDRVHSNGRESRGPVRIEFSVPIRYFMLGINGWADVVAYHLTDIWWKHNCKSGQYSSAKVHKTLAVTPDGRYKLNNLDDLMPKVMNS